MRNRKYTNNLFCFSPPVMLATFLVEIALAIYTFLRYKLDTSGRLGLALLAALGIFQLSEYMVCGGLGLKGIEWARFGYIAITLLPAMGMHLIATITGKKHYLLVGAAYLSCAAFVAYYLLTTASVVEKACYANYAVFGSHPLVSKWFGIYYYTWLMLGVSLSWYWSNRLPEKRIALQSLAVGYLVFMLPTAVVNVIDKNTIAGIPSIMCGFAVLFAIILSAKVLPLTCLTKNQAEQSPLKKSA